MPETDNLPVSTPPTNCCDCACDGPVQDSGGGSYAPMPFSEAPVRYFDGTVQLVTTDLSSDGFGAPWGQTRSWTNGRGYAPRDFSGRLMGFNGNGMVDAQLPYVLTANNFNTAIVVLSGTNALFFDNVNSLPIPRFFITDQLTHANGEFILTDTAGDQVHFFDFTGAPNNPQWGKFKGMTDAAGNITTVTAWTTDGKAAEVERSTPVGQAPAVTESFLYTYLPSTDLNAGLLASVILRRRVNGGGWTTVRQVAYDYYDGTSAKPYGNLGDLRTATIQDANNNVIDTTYYRYWPSQNGFDGLKYLFNPQSYARLAAVVPNPLTAADQLVATYADNYFEYDSQRRVTKEVAQGEGSSSASGGLGTFTFSYTSSVNAPGSNSWAYKTVETLPDNSPTFVSQNIVYSNANGEIMLKVYQSGPPGSTQQWEVFYKYDNAGRVILKADPSALSGYDDTKPDLLNSVSGHYQYMYDHQGKVELTDYYNTTTANATTSGGVAGYYDDTKLQFGQLGTPILQAGKQYYVHAVGVDVTATTAAGTSATSPADQYLYTAPPAPVANQLSMTSGSTLGGAAVTIVGRNFSGATGVFFDGAPATFTVAADSAIQAASPAHATGAVDVTVVTPGGWSATSPADQFTYNLPIAPVVTGLSPTSGLTTGGTIVTVIGSHLSGATAVSFGGTSADPTSIVVLSDNALEVHAPAHALGMVDITVTTPGSTSSTSAADQYTYVSSVSGGGPPVVAGVAPTTGSYLGSNRVIIIGSGFTNTSSVSFDGSQIPAFLLTVLSDNAIQANAPNHAAGTVDVTVTTPNGTSATSAADQYTYTLPPTPTVTGLTVTTGTTLGGNRMVILGSGFTAANTDLVVSFDGAQVPASSHSVLSDNAILVSSVPAHAAGTVDVTVANPSGTSATSAADQYVYTTPPQPVVTGLSLTSGPLAGNSGVVILGSGFSGAIGVSFGTASVYPFTILSDNAIQVSSPQVTATGTVDVIVTTPGGTSATSAADQFTYTYTAPVVTGLSPTSGLTSGGNSVTIIGTGFANATGVYFGSVFTPAYLFSYLSNNAIQVTAPSHAAGTVDVTVAIPGGNSAVTPADQYTYVTSSGGGPLAVTGLGPNNGSTLGGSTVTIIGSGFTGATVVSFDGTPVASGNFQVVNDNAIRVTSTPAHAAGVVDVTVTTPSGTSATNPADQFTYAVPPAPVVTGASLAAGSVFGNATVILLGSHFNGTTVVSFGGSLVQMPQYTVLTDNAIEVTSPAHATTGVYPVATSTVYRNDSGSDLGPETTSYAYTWFNSPNGEATTRMQSQTVSLPVVSAVQNGPGVADTETTVYDTYGREVWHKDADGFIDYRAYDAGTGAITRAVADVDTTKTVDFQNLPAGWMSPTANPLHLITQIMVDGLGRPLHITSPNQNSTYLVYFDPVHLVAGYLGWDPVHHVPTGPTQVYREDRPGSYIETFTTSVAPVVDGNGLPTGAEFVNPTTNQYVYAGASLQTLSRTLTNAAGQVVFADGYFNLGGLTYSTTPTLGTEGVNFYRTRIGYDAHGRANRVQDPTGTIQRTVYDGLGRVVSTWLGTSDTGATDADPTGGGTQDNNMVQLSLNVYDNGGPGDGDLTQTTAYPGGSALPRVTQFFWDWRDRLVATKGGVQATEDNTTHRPITFTVYDNLGEPITQQEYDGDGVPILPGSNGVPYIPTQYLNRLRAQVNTLYDNQGRPYQTQTFSVDLVSGTVSATALVANSWYDHRGNLIKIAPSGGPVTKTQYDGAGRPAVQYVGDGKGDMTWADAGSVANNNVLSQVETTYDKDGNILLTADRERFDNETATGALMNPTTSPKARVSYQAAWYDAADRLVASADAGTNGGLLYVPPAMPPVGSTDTLLVTFTTYNAAGWVDTVTDPRGLVSKKFYDNLGRVGKSVADYTGGIPGDSNDQTTEYAYDGDNHVTQIQAVLALGALQQTNYVYGVQSSVISSNDLLRAVVYPDNGQPNTETYTYNALGEVTTDQDRLGTTHAYTYDVLGRQVSDTATITSALVDRSVQRLDTAYDTQGNPYKFTSYADQGGTSLVNQVQRFFNGLGQLTREVWVPPPGQGAVTVQYTYSNMLDSQGQYANHSRPTGIIYPNGRTVSYSYGSAGGVDDTISRLDALVDQGGTGPTLEALTYLGLDTVVQRSHPEANLTLSYINAPGGSSDGGDQYTGLDRFGRVVDQYWSVGGTATDNFQYAYDRDSNPLTRTNALNGAFSEQYGYDALNRLTTFMRGSHSQSWSLDALGNWTSFTNDGTPQARGFNNQNQATSVGGNTLTYDANGNTTTDEQGNAFVYDAWNRLVRVTTAGGGTDAYSYDALGRRITAQVNGGPVTDLYYSSSWQVIEEQVSGAMTAQYVWSPVYVDALVERDTATGPRLYVQQDADWNVTALVKPTDTVKVKERFAYDPYGKATVVDPTTWQVRGGGTYGSSNFGWVYLHQGGRYERYSDAAGMYLFRRRDYSPTLGRWMEQDPAGYAGGGANLYEYGGSEPASNVDPSGLSILDQIKEVIDVGGDIAALDTKYALGVFGINVDVDVQSNFFRNITPDTVERAGGALQALGGAGESALGLTLFEIPFIGPIATGVFGPHGADNFATGMDRVLNGDPSQTYTSQTLGPEVDQAINNAAAVTGIIIGLGELARPTPQDFGGGGGSGGGGGTCRPLVPEEPVTLLPELEPLPPLPEPVEPLPPLPEPVEPLPWIEPIPEPAPIQRTQIVGTQKPPTTGGVPNSIYTHVNASGEAIQNAIYDAQGNVIGHVDFKPHEPDAPSGHGHSFSMPGDPSSGHGPGMPHIPYDQLPPGWGDLPPGVTPYKPIGAKK